MFARKSGSKASKGMVKGNPKAKKAIKRLLEKPTPERMAHVANLAAAENLLPFNVSALGQAGACEAVAEVMANFPEHRLIQMEACRAVESLADGSKQNVHLLGEANCCQLVEKALKRFPNEATVQAQGCRAVTVLFNGEANIKKLEQGQACELVTQALRSFPADADVQIEGCGAVANLANNCKNNRIRLGRAGACALVTKCMSTFPGNIDVQHAACVAVGNLANRHEENKKLLGAAGACNKVCAALAGFQEDHGVQYMGIGAVGNLSNSNAQNCARLGEAGGCLLVASGMNAFPTDRNLQHVGCAAVANLAINNGSNAARLNKAGAKAAVQRALAVFPDDKEIQTRGTQALEWLSSKNRSGSTRSMLKLTGPESTQTKAKHRPYKSDGGEIVGNGVNHGGRGREQSDSDISVEYVDDDSDSAIPSVVRDVDANKDNHNIDDNEGACYPRDPPPYLNLKSANERPLGVERDWKPTKGVVAAAGARSRGRHSRDSSVGSSGPKMMKGSVEPAEEDRQRRHSRSVSVGSSGSQRMRGGVSAAGVNSGVRHSGGAPMHSRDASGASSGRGKTVKGGAVPPGVGSGGRHPRGASAEVAKHQGAIPPAVAVPPAPTAPVCVGVVPTPPNNRPRSRAEQPIGELLEDFDSDGEGTYGPAPVPVQHATGAGGAAEAEEAVTGGGKNAVGPPPKAQAPSPDMLVSGGDPAAPQQHQRVDSSSHNGHNRTKEGPRGGKGGSGSRGTSGGDPATRNGSSSRRSRRSADTAAATVGDDGDNGDEGGWGGDRQAAPTRRAMEELERAATAQAAQAEGHRQGSGWPRGSRGSRGSQSPHRRISTSAISLQSSGAVVVPSEFPGDGSERGSRTRSERSFGSFHSHRRQTAEEILMNPAMATAPGVAELIRHDHAVANTLQTITGRKPTLLPKMLADVERLVQRSREMETVMIGVVTEVTCSDEPPVGESLLRREYFNVLYRGLCGAHIAAAVVARGGIVADSKDGWLRKASALVRIVSLACPAAKAGVELLGMSLQRAQRDKMADYVEQVAKSSKSPRDVSSLIAETALRLLGQEGRAEADERSLDATALKNTTDEWLPVWLLEEAAVKGDQGDGGVVVAGIPLTGPPGTEFATRAAMVDGCTIITAIGNRSLATTILQDKKVDLLVEAVVRSVPAGAPPLSSAPEAASELSRSGSRNRPQHEENGRREDQASATFYPPISPSTIAPGQGPAPSSTRSAFGAAWQAGREAAVAQAAASTKDVAAADKLRRPVSPRRPPMSSKAEKAVKSYYLNKSGVEPSSSPKPCGSDRGSNGVNAAANATTTTASMGTSATVRASLSDDEEPIKPSQPSTHGRKTSGKIVVPDVFRQSTKPPSQFMADPLGPAAVANGVEGNAVFSNAAVKPRPHAVTSAAAAAAPVQRGRQQPAETGVAAKGGGGGDNVAAVASKVGAARAPSAGDVEDPSAEATDQTRSGARPVVRGGDADKNKVTSVTSAASRATTAERKTGPRKPRLGRNAAPSGSPGRRQGEALGLEKGKDMPKGGQRRGNGEGSKGRSPKQISFSGVGNAARGTARGRPGGGGAGGARVATAQKSWGRSGSWYEPRKQGKPSASVAAPALPGQEEGDDEDEDSEAGIGGGGGGGSVREGGDMLDLSTPPLKDKALRRPRDDVRGRGRRSSSRSRSNSRHSNSGGENPNETVAGGVSSNNDNNVNGFQEADMYFIRKQKASKNNEGRERRGGEDPMLSDRASRRRSNAAAMNSGYADSACGSVAPPRLEPDNGVYGHNSYGVSNPRAIDGGSGGGSRKPPHKTAANSKSGWPQDQQQGHSPAGYVHGAEQLAQRRQEGGRGRGAPTSPSSSKRSSKSSSSSKFFNNFLSNSKKMAQAEAAAKDTFGSSDGSESSEGASRPTHRRRESRGSNASSTSMGIGPVAWDQYTVAPSQPQGSGEVSPTLVKSSSVSMLIAKTENKLAGSHTRRGSGSSRWPFSGTR